MISKLLLNCVVKLNECYDLLIFFFFEIVVVFSEACFIGHVIEPRAHYDRMGLFILVAKILLVGSGICWLEPNQVFYDSKFINAISTPTV